MKFEPSRLQHLVRKTWKESAPYQDLWRENGLTFENLSKLEDLSSIPVMTKEHLLSYGLKDRANIDATKFYYLTLSGGTTAEPTHSLVTEYIAPTVYTFFKRHKKTSSVLIVRPAVFASAMLGGTASSNSNFFDGGSIIALGDPEKLSITAKLGKALETDFLIIRPSAAVRFAHELQRIGYDPYHIEFLWVTGEPLTQQCYELLKRLYPRALIVSFYAITEAPSALGIRSSLCSALDSLSTHAYHMNTEGHYFENKNDDFLITSYTTSPVPLIRYRIGDNVRLFPGFQCSCGQTGLVGLVGTRKNIGTYKFNGFTFKVQDVSRILESFEGLTSTRFNLKLEEEVVTEKLLTKITLELGEPKPSQMILMTLERALLNQWFIAKEKTLQAAITEKSVVFKGINVGKLLPDEKRVTPPSDITKPFEQKLPP